VKVEYGTGPGIVHLRVLLSIVLAFGWWLSWPVLYLEKCATISARRLGHVENTPSDGRKR
jgi:hypothetical protein